MENCSLENSTIHPTFPSKHINMSSGLTLLVVYVLVISLNILIIFVIFRVKHKSLRWSLDYLVSFLAITDLISTLVGVPIPILAYFQGYWPGGCSPGAQKTFSTFNVTCKLFYLFLTWGRLSTMFIITVMCMERFLAITRPFVHREVITAGRLRKCVYVIWTVMFIYCFLPILNVGHVSLHFNKHLDNPTESSSTKSYFFCFLEYDKLDTNTKSGIGNLIYSVIFVLFGVVSLTIVLICVFFICRILLGRKPKINKTTKSNQKESASNTYSLNSPKLVSPGTKTESLMSKVSVFAKSRSFLSKRRPSIKKYESEELQFVALMLMIAGIFYITFLPIMLLVITHIAGVGFGDLYTFWSMRFTSFVVVANPVIYGCSNKLYRVGCIYVFRSMFNMCLCKKTPIPERLGRRNKHGSSIAITSSRTRSMTATEKTAQDFIIAASPDKDRAIVKAFVGNMKRGVEGNLSEGESFGILLPEDSLVTENLAGESSSSPHSVAVEPIVQPIVKQGVKHPVNNGNIPVQVQHCNVSKDFSSAKFSPRSESCSSLVGVDDV